MMLGQAVGRGIFTPPGGHRDIRVSSKRIAPALEIPRESYSMGEALFLWERLYAGMPGPRCRLMADTRSGRRHWAVLRFHRSNPIAFIVLKYKDIFSEKRCRETKGPLPSGSRDDAPTENDRNALREQHYIFYIITHGEFYDTRLPASLPDRGSLTKHEKDDVHR